MPLITLVPMQLSQLPRLREELTRDEDETGYRFVFDHEQMQKAMDMVYWIQKGKDQVGFVMVKDGHVPILLNVWARFRRLGYASAVVKHLESLVGPETASIRVHVAGPPGCAHFWDAVGYVPKSLHGPAFLHRVVYKQLLPRPAEL